MKQHCAFHDLCCPAHAVACEKNVQLVRGQMGVRKLRFQHCRPGHSGLGVKKTQNTTCCGEKTPEALLKTLARFLKKVNF